MHRFIGLIARFGRDERGVFAVMFGLMAVVLIALGGAVVDYVTLEQVRNRSQIALDAAALALQPEIEDLSRADLILKAQGLLTDRIGNDSVVATVTDAIVSTSQGSLRFTASIRMPTIFISLVGVNEMRASIQSEARRQMINVEVSVALDVTGSMAGQRIIDLRAAMADLVSIVVQDDQSLTTSRVAMAPYSQAVNAGNFAAALRGPIVSSKNISNITWVTGTTRSITSVTRANPAVVTTSVDHGFQNGDWVFVWGVGGLTPTWNGGRPSINGVAYQVANKTNTTFQLSGFNTSSGYQNNGNSGYVRKCANANCNVVISSTGHAMAANDWVYITDVGGYTMLNNAAWQIASATTNSVTLSSRPATAPTSTTNYTSSTGRLHCTVQTTAQGCPYYRFANLNGGYTVFPITTCVTERALNGANDTPPSTTFVGRNYPGNNNGCLTNTIVPLTSDKPALNTAIAALADGGSTSGSLGILWSWYMLSPEFGYVWPALNQPGEYGEEDLAKFAIIMTDGEFNTVHCNGVVARNSTSGSGGNADHINCNAPNGDPYDQAEAYCDAMKAPSNQITVYTIGFGIAEGTTAANVLEYCATTEDRAYLAATGQELRDAFRRIAGEISQLHLTQ